MTSVHIYTVHCTIVFVLRAVLLCVLSPTAYVYAVTVVSAPAQGSALAHYSNLHTLHATTPLCSVWQRVWLDSGFRPSGISKQTS